MIIFKKCWAKSKEYEYLYKILSSYFYKYSNMFQIKEFGSRVRFSCNKKSGVHFLDRIFDHETINQSF